MPLQERLDVGSMFITKSESVQEGKIINTLTVRIAIGSHIALENPSHKTSCEVLIPLLTNLNIF